MTSSVTLWRIASETREYSANDLSGRGSAQFPGRWNKYGERLIYAAQSVALAVLETAAHVDSSGLPLNRFVVRITVQAKIWDARQQINVAEIETGWCAVPAGRASVDIGSKWYKTTISALLVVPSVIVPEDTVVLINAMHPDAKFVKAETLRPFEFNKLFRRYVG